MIPVRSFAGTCEISTGAFIPSSTPPAFQGEAQAIEVSVQFLKDGAAYTIPNDVTPFLYLYYDAEGAHTMARAMTKENDTATGLLSEQEQRLPGSPFLAIRLVDDAQNVIVGFAVRIQIQRLLGKETFFTIPPEAYEQAIIAANEAAANANLAADRAEAASLSIEQMTVAAEGLPAGSNPSIAVSDVAGRKHLAFGIPKGDKGDTGEGLQILGLYPSLSALQTAHPTGEEGDIFAVGTADNNALFVWQADALAWVDIGGIKGETFPINGVYPSEEGYTLDAQHIPAGGWRNVQEGLEGLQKAMCNENLLHNYDFLNPVNQKASIQTIDRWKASSTLALTLTISADGFGMAVSGLFSNDGIYQTLEFPKRLSSLTVTLSFVAGSIQGKVRAVIQGASAQGAFSYPGDIAQSVGTVFVSATLPADISAMSVGVFFVDAVSGNSATFTKAKLEVGDISTIETEPPADYATELAKCQRFYQDIGKLSFASDGPVVRATVIAAGVLRFAVPLLATMRAMPTLIGGSGFRVFSVPANVEATGFTFSVSGMSSGQLDILATKANHGLTDARLYIPSGALSAEL